MHIILASNVTCLNLQDCSIMNGEVLCTNLKGLVEVFGAALVRLSGGQLGFFIFQKLTP